MRVCWAALLAGCTVPHLSPGDGVGEAPSAGDAGAAAIMVPDACKASMVGIYCGASLHLDPLHRYSCTGGTGATTLDMCAVGCGESQPPGNATCFNPQCPGDGAYCGGMIGGDPSTLYVCAGGALATSSPCPFRCLSGPTAGTDFCANGATPPTGVIAAALDGGAVVEWTAAEDPMTGFTISSQPSGPMVTVDPGQRMVRLTGLSDGTTYAFVVQADSGTPSVPSNPVTPATGSMILPEVPHYHQQHSATCESSALSMVLVHAGIDVGESAIMAAIGIDSRSGYVTAGTLNWGDPYTSFVGSPDGSEQAYTGYGTYYPNIARVAAARGAIVLLAGESTSPATLYGEILQGHPAIAWITGDLKTHDPVMPWVAFDGTELIWYGGYEHAVAVVGVTPDAIIVNNPDITAPWQSIPKTIFEPSYGQFNQMAVVIE